MQIKLSNISNLKCEKCGNETWESVFFVKVLSPIITGESTDVPYPIPTFACNACGWVPKIFIQDHFLELDNPQIPDPNRPQPGGLKLHKP